MLARRFYHRIDLWLQRLKWPIATFAVLWTPLLLWAWVLLGYRVVEQPFSSIWFCSGVLLFFVAWKSLLRYQNAWRWLMRVEHEATHLLFAVLTGHPIVGWRSAELVGSDQTTDQTTMAEAPIASNTASANNKNTRQKSEDPNRIQFVGTGNWLIQIAPYFFPTAAGVLWFAALFIPLGFLGWTTIALGIATGFHITSTILEIRADRAELDELDLRFCMMFLPAANLLLLGCLVSFSQAGLSGAFHFISDSWQPIRELIRMFS